MIEDLETSYWPEFGGGGKDSTMEVLKSRVDNLNHAGMAHDRAGEKKRTVKDFNIESIHFYPSICFIKRK